MSEWTDGYRAALADVERLIPGRADRWPHGLTMAVVARLLADLDQDALVIEREQDNRIRKRRLAAVREADRSPELALAQEWLADQAPL